MDVAYLFVVSFSIRFHVKEEMIEIQQNYNGLSIDWYSRKEQTESPKKIALDLRSCEKLEMKKIKKEKRTRKREKRRIREKRSVKDKEREKR